MTKFKFFTFVFITLFLTGCIERHYLIKWDSFQKPTIHLFWTGDSIDLETGPLTNINDQWLLMLPESSDGEQSHSFTQFGMWNGKVNYNQEIELIEKSSPINPTLNFKRYFLGILRVHQFTVTIPCASNLAIDNPMKGAPEKPTFNDDTDDMIISPQTKKELQNQYDKDLLQFYVKQLENVLQNIRDSLVHNKIVNELPNTWAETQSKRWSEQLDHQQPSGNLLYYWEFIKDSILPTTLPPDKMIKAIQYTNSIEKIHQIYHDMSDESISFQLVKKGLVIATNADSIAKDSLYWQTNYQMYSNNEPIQLKATMILFDPFGTLVVILIISVLLFYRIKKRSHT